MKKEAILPIISALSLAVGCATVEAPSYESDERYTPIGLDESSIAQYSPYTHFMDHATQAVIVGMARTAWDTEAMHSDVILDTYTKACDYRISKTMVTMLTVEEALSENEKTGQGWAIEDQNGNYSGLLGSLNGKQPLLRIGPATRWFDDDRLAWDTLVHELLHLFESCSGTDDYTGVPTGTHDTVEVWKVARPKIQEIVYSFAVSWDLSFTDAQSE